MSVKELNILLSIRQHYVLNKDNYLSSSYLIFAHVKTEDLLVGVLCKGLFRNELW